MSTSSNLSSGICADSVEFCAETIFHEAEQSWFIQLYHCVAGLSNQQKLMHRQRFLEGHRQVGHYFPFNGDGCIIHLATQVFVKDQTGTLTPYFFESYDTVLTLKNSITDKKGQ